MMGVVDRIVFPPFERTINFVIKGEKVDTPYPILVLWGRGLDLVQAYYNDDLDCDGHSAGVLADWFEDNVEECVSRTLGLTTERLLMFVARLREIFANPDRNTPQ